MTCDLDTGRRFIEGELSQDDEAKFIDHLSGCRRCQQSLERTAGDEQVWVSTRALLKSSSEIVHWSDSSMDPITSMYRDGCDSANTAQRIVDPRPSGQ
jgi:hypothetical protein